MKRYVAIILLNWNGLEETQECIFSLGKLTYKNYYIIIVDNHSKIDSSKLNFHDPNIILIRNKENFGFAKGNNIGIQKAIEFGCKYCWILNNDTIVSKDSLATLLSIINSDDEVAAVTNQIRYYSNPSIIWFNGGIFKNGIPVNRTYNIDLNCNNFISFTDFLCGCSLLARTDVLERIGSFDENYFCYIEDVDLSLRMIKLGYKIYCIHIPLVFHKVSRSTGKHSPIKLYYKHRNMLYFLKKFAFSKLSIIFWWSSSIRFIISLLLRHRNYKAAWSIVLGMKDAVFLKMGKRTNIL